MDRPQGMRGILHGHPDRDINEELTIGNFDIELRGNVVAIGYDTPPQEPEAETIVSTLMGVHSFRLGRLVNASLVTKWSIGPAGEVFTSTLATDTIGITDTVTTDHTTFTTTGGITIEQTGPRSERRFSPDVPMAQRALADPALAQALGYFAASLVEGATPLVEYYKAIETLSLAAKKASDRRNGQEALAARTRISRQAINNLMQTAQPVRHSPAATSARAVLSPDQCKFLTKELIRNYANNI